MATLQSTSVSGSLIISGSTSPVTRIIGSGSTLLSVSGSLGELFAVTDELSGSLFSVNNDEGLPLLEVFSDGIVNIGTVGEEAIIVNGNTASITGSVFGTATTASYVDFPNIDNKPALISGSAEGDNQGQIKLNGQNVNTNNLGTDDSPSFAGLTVDTNTLYVDATNNRVGIGTTSPGSNLDVEDVSGVVFRLSNPANGGTSTIVSTGYDSANVERFSSAIDFQSVAGNSTSNGHIIFSTYPSNTKTERMRIDLDGNVGIGTTSPTDKLDVFSSSNNQRLVRLSHPTAPTAAAGFLGFNTDGTIDNNIVTIGVQYSSDYYNVINIQRSTQNVGIGTTSPSAKLHTTGVGYFSGGTISFTDTVTNAGIVIDEEDYIYTKDNLNLRKLIGKSLDVIHIGQSGTSLIDEIRLLPGNSGIVTVYDNTAEVARFTGGNVGIGTTTPSYRLDVSGSIGVSNRIQVDDGINIGITGSDARLHINQYFSGEDDLTVGNLTLSSRSVGMLIEASGLKSGNNLVRPGIYMFNSRTDTSGLAFPLFKVYTGKNDSYSATNGGIFGAFASDGGDQFKYLYFGVNNKQSYNDNVVKITESGMGILLSSTTEPSYTLDVNGDIRVTDDLFVDDFARIDALRVGTTSTDPGDKRLVVEGSAIFNEDGGDYDFRVESDTNPNMIFVDASTDRVGIGTASPANTLDVNGTLKTSGNALLGIASSLHQLYGTVAINTNTVPGTVTSPSKVFNVDGSGSDVYGMFTQDGNNAGWLSFYAGATSAYMFYKNTGNLIWGNSTQAGGNSFSEKMRLDSSGNLGIGASSPNAKLDVRGSAIFNEDGGNNDFRIESDTKTHMFFVDASADKIGINESSPEAPIHLTQTIDRGDGGLLLESTQGAAWAIYVDTSNLFFVQSSGGGTGFLASGTDVSNIDFTGQHRSKESENFTTGSYDDLIGLIVISDGTYNNFDNSTSASINEALPNVQLSDKINDKRVFGVISDKEDLENGRTYSTGMWNSVFPTGSDDSERLVINSVGEGGIWVCNYSGSFENGDYITTSPILGLGMNQNDEYLKNYTVAKITQDCDFNDSKKYIEFEHSGSLYRKQFVGCTYHCG